jgi:hypothetical protein
VDSTYISNFASDLQCGGCVLRSCTAFTYATATVWNLDPEPQANMSAAHVLSTRT